MYSGVRESVEDNLYVGKRLSAGVVDSSCIGKVILLGYHSQWLCQKILYPKWFLQWLVNTHLYVWRYLAPRSEEQYSLGIEVFYHFHNHDYGFVLFS